MKFALRSLLVMFTLASSLQAQTVNTANKSFQIPKVDAEPTIDGQLSPGEWDDAVVIDDFYEVRPIEFAEAKMRTVYYLKYTEDALLVGVYAYDNPANITAQVLRHGVSLMNDDRVHILLDTFNNQRSGYQFQTNPNGVRYEGLYTGANGISYEWTAIWDAGAQIVADGWTAEMRIPFKSLTFSPDSDTWGVNFWREIPRDRSRIGWMSRNGQSNLPNSGTMSGLTGLNQGMGLDITPVLSSTYADNELTGARSEANPSLDMTYKLTPSLNLTLTLNTDFAATEVDSIQLDLGRFSTRLQEKRGFFLTDMDIFAFAPRGGMSGGSGGGGGGGAGSPDPFFSRNIGIVRGQAVDLIGGVKLSGRIGGFDVGTLLIRQDEAGTVDATNLFVGRLKRTVLTESELGVIYTNGDPSSNDETSTLGVDFTYRNTRIGNNRDLEIQLWAQQSDNPGVTSDNMAWNASFNLPSRNSWNMMGRVQEVQENFDPRLGFANRTGVRQYSLTGGNYWIFRGHPWIQQIQSSLALAKYENLDDGSRQSSSIDWTIINLSTISGDVLSLNASKDVELLRVGERVPLASLGVVIPADEYNNYDISLMLNTSGARSWDSRLRVSGGDYYTGTRLVVGPAFGWRLNKHLSFDLNYTFTQYDMPDVKAYTRVATITNEVAFSPSLSLVNIVQYENVSDSLGLNSRFRWNLGAGKDIWFVLSHNMSDTDENGEFTRVESSASFKFSYTLRY